tara:strand:- start:31 stop:246 length:216 start_codon:yes stop_codon:yes gene_type:complete
MDTLRISQSAATQKHFKNWLRHHYKKKFYSIDRIITKRDARSYNWGTYTAVIKKKKILRDLNPYTYKGYLK